MFRDTYQRQPGGVVVKYLFEDKKEDKFSKLYCSSLPDDIKKDIYYAQGNGYLVSEAEKLLHNGEKVIVFLDTVPNNKENIL